MRLTVLLLSLVSLIISTNSQASPYRLKPGDTLEVSVWQDPKLNRQIVVAPDGRIAFPLVGHLRAGGLTLEGVEAILKDKLKKQYTDDVDVTVMLVAIKEEPFVPPPPPPPEEKPPDPTIFVTGEVNKPGQYAIKVPTNVLQAIAMSGGLGQFAAEHRIKIRRKVNGKETLFSFDYGNFESGKDLSGNIRLHAGDVVIVPEKGLFE